MPFVFRGEVTALIQRVVVNMAIKQVIPNKNNPPVLTGKKNRYYIMLSFSSVMTCDVIDGLLWLA